MRPDDLRDHLTEHVHDIHAFMDHEATLMSDDEFAHLLAHWFANPAFDARGHRFVHLGHDGSGSHFAAWLRPDADDVPVVLFGSEGGTGVLADTIDRWPHILAHAPWISEGHDEPSHVTSLPSSLLEEDEHAEEALKAYREATAEQFGPLPPLEALLTGLDPLDDAFQSWVQSSLAT